MPYDYYIEVDNFIIWRSQMGNKANLNDALEKQVEKKQEDKGLLNYKESFETLLIKMKPEIEKALPKHMSPDRLLRIVLTNVRMNPKLLECSKPSVLGAIMQAAQLGLEPGLLGQAYLIPYKNWKTGKYDCQFIAGYQGLLNLVRRSGQIETIYAGAVRENDLFDVEFGLHQNLKHIPLMKGDRGPLSVFYAYAITKDGGSYFDFMTLDEVKRIRDTYSKGKDADTSPWKTEFEEMGKKTILRRLSKLLPMSIEIVSAIASDETVKTEITENMAENSLDIGFMQEDDSNNSYVDVEVKEES